MRTVLFAIQPEVVLLDVAGAGEAFRIAEREVPGSYQLRYVSTQPTVRSAVGLHLDGLEPLPEPVPDNSIIVVTGVTTKALRLDSAPTTALVNWLKRAMANESVTLMCVCAGALLAAKAGLLTGRECTTHHHHIEDIQRLEPSATVHANRIFVEDGRIFTSAGVTAGIDLTLYMIGQQLGHQVAVAVARELAPLRRRSAAVAVGHASQSRASGVAPGAGRCHQESCSGMVRPAPGGRRLHELTQSRETVRRARRLLAARLCPAFAGGARARAGHEQRARDGARRGEDGLQFGPSAAARVAALGNDAADAASRNGVPGACLAPRYSRRAWVISFAP